MKHRFILLVVAVLALSACRRDRVDTRALTPHHRALFAEAAAIEGVDTTIHGRPGDWTVEYDFDLPRYGNADSASLVVGSMCKIFINPNRLSNCDGNNTDQYFAIISRHEMRHCAGAGHSINSEDLMYYNPACSIVD